MSTRPRVEMTTRERLEDTARRYEIPIVLAAEWNVERAEKAERQARSNLTRAINAVPKAQRQCDIRLGQLREYPNSGNLPYEEGRAIGRVQSAEGKVDRRRVVAERAAAVLAEAQAELAALREAAV